MGQIADNVTRVLDDLPPDVQLVAAAKTRTVDEVREAVDAGVQIIGHNYVQEAEAMAAELDRDVRWHGIGHLQRNKAGTAVALFDMIETLDSPRLARELNKRAGKAGTVQPCLIEVNIGREDNKTGALPEDVEALIRRAAELEHLRIEGLMTMSPYSPDPEHARPYFREAKQLFDHIKAISVPNVAMQHLSMGMSNTWRIAIAEGATLVRIGTALFGERT